MALSARQLAAARVTMGQGVPSNQIALAQQYGRQYRVDPRLLLAIGGHETHWGTLGAGRQGYTLGYGATDTGLLNQYAGVANQYRGAAKTLAGWGARSIGDVLAGKASRYATDPAWEKGVAQTYASLGGKPTLDATRFNLPDASLAPRGPSMAPAPSTAPAPLDRGAIIRQAFLGQLQGKQFSLLDLMRQLREQRTTAAAQPAAPAVGQAAAPVAAGVAPSDKGRADPLKGKIIGRPYEGTHADIPNWESQRAIDVAAPIGSPIYSPFAGTIGSQFGSLGAAPSSRFGGLRMHVVGPTDEAYLAHLSRFAPGIRPGRRVRPGQLLGYSGSASGVAHLHEALKYGDPYSLVR
jgi:murein DD-endopeptidase MepM/ murein hydrolase activator NlpD